MLQDPEVLYRIETGTADGRARHLQARQLRASVAALVLALGQRARRCFARPAPRRASLLDAARARNAATRLLARRPRARAARALSLDVARLPRHSRHAPSWPSAFSLETNKLIEKVVFDQPSSYLDLFTSTANVRQRDAGRPIRPDRARAAAKAGCRTPTTSAPASCRTAACWRRSANSATPAPRSAASSSRRACSVTRSRRRPPT